jgi:hypothetical protein
MQQMMINKFPYFIGPTDSQQQFTTYLHNHPSQQQQQQAPFYVNQPGMIPGTHLISPYSIAQQVRFQQIPSQTYPQLLPQQQQHIAQLQDLKLNHPDSASSTDSTSPPSSQSPGLIQQQQQQQQHQNLHKKTNNEINISDEDRTGIKSHKNQKSAPSMMLNQQQKHYHPQQQQQHYSDRNMIRNQTPSNYLPIQHQNMQVGPYIQQIPNLYYNCNNNNDRALYSNTPPPQLQQQQQIHPTSNPQLTSIPSILMV